MKFRLLAATITVASLSSTAIVASAIVAPTPTPTPTPAPTPPEYRASASIAGPGITGTLHFKQLGNSNAVQIVGKVTGLAPGNHGLHLHEVGACDAPGGFATAGGHVDPGPSGNSAEANHPHHAGDLPNLVAGGDGVAAFTFTTTHARLSPGGLGLFDGDGSSVVVTAGADTGVPGSSGGARVACGVLIDTTPPPIVPIQFSFAYTQGQNSPVGGCDVWNGFRADLVGKSFTRVQTGDAVCTVPALANQICQGLAAAAPVSVTCDGRSWNVGLGCGGIGNPVVELSADGSLCNCLNPGYSVRPCIGNSNWGGSNTATCGGPSQTLQVVCTPF